MEYEYSINSRVFEAMQEVADVAAEKLAGGFYKRLRSYIQGLQDKLNTEEQLIAYFYSSSGEKFLVKNIGSIDPDMIVFDVVGENNHECGLLSHMNAVQLFFEYQKIESESVKRKIGFLTE